MKDNIALLVDSGLNVPNETLALPGVYEVPLTIIYNEQSFTDKIDITTAEIYDRLDSELPKTSLPQGERIYQTLERIVNDGYTHLIVMTISSKLSGTYNAIKLMTEEFPQLTVTMVDTKSAAIGGGLQGIIAKELIDSDKAFNELVSLIEKNVTLSRIYFSLPTLEYLKRGGRISSVTSLIGSSLNLHPVISCNSAGEIWTPTKARGRKKSIQKMINEGIDFLEEGDGYDLVAIHTNCESEALPFVEALKNAFPNYRHFYFSQASPVIGIHTGPDALGFSILKIQKEELT